MARQHHDEAYARMKTGAPRAADDARGRRAERPSDIPRRGWRDILLRIKDAVSGKSLSLVAAGAAFYAFLAIPSAIAALVSLYGLMADPAEVRRQVDAMRGVVPGEAVGLLSDQLKALTSHSNKTLGIGLVLSVLVALWSAKSATTSMMSALNIAFEESEKRGILRYYATAFALTFSMIVLAILALGLIAVLPAALGVLPLGDTGKAVASIMRWPVLVVLIMAALAVIYRFGPSREQPRWRWVSWGAAAAVLLWIAGSALFSVYVGEFASYDKSYGSLGAVVVLLMWLYLSAYAVLLGAELNAEIEHQTARDTTTGREQPMGRRGAKVADTLGGER